MNTGKTLFAQLLDFLPWTTFTRIVERHGGEQPKRFADIVVVNNDFDRPRIELPSNLAPHTDAREPCAPGGRREASHFVVASRAAPLGSSLEVAGLHLD